MERTEDVIDSYLNRIDMILKKIILVAVLVFGITLSMVLVGLYSTRSAVDERTQLLCKEYAERNHEAEINPERYKWLGEDFVNSYDWYESCINHVKYPVAL